MTLSHTLKRRAFEGVIWAGGQAVVSKVVTFGAQLVLARLLVPAEFGLIAMANSIAFLMGAMQSGGVRSILIRRQTHIALWLNPAFWYSTALGLVAGALILVVSPTVASYYGQPVLSNLMPIMVAGMLIENLAVVPSTMLQARLDFRTLGFINICTPVGQAALSIVFAWTGFGAISLVLPKIPVGLVVGAVLWRAAAFRPKPCFQMKRWRYLVADSGLMLLAWFSFAAAGQIPVALLARAHGPEYAGIFSFAVTVTTQVIMLLAAQLDSVLFPALAKLSLTPDMQWRAFVKATVILAQIVFFISGAQILLAGPVVQALFTDRWQAAIPLIQLFSVGNAILATAIPTGGTMQARGRLKTYCGFAVFSLGISILTSVGATLLGAEPLFYVGASVTYQVVISIVSWRLVAGMFNASIDSLFKILMGPLLVTILVVTAGLVILARFSAGGTLQIAAVVGFGYAITWAILMLMFFRKTMTESFRQVTSIIYAKQHT
jgi:O-antigen/teichoic acid export membrane protein